jgi:hypothetical protein
MKANSGDEKTRVLGKRGREVALGERDLKRRHRVLRHPRVGVQFRARSQ